MEYKAITLEDLKNAKFYMPIMKKAEFIDRASSNCFSRLSVQANYDEENVRALPHMYKENTFLKSCYLMGALLKYYFQFDVDTVGDDPWLITADEYDRYAGGRIFENLQRFKSIPEVRDKAYDILADYKDLENRLNREIHGMLTAMNDPVSRAMMTLTQAMTPEEMTKLLENLDDSQKQLQDYIAGKQANGAMAAMSEA